MVLGTPAPVVSAFVDAVDEAIHAHDPGQGLSAIQRAWLAFGLTAILVTNAICWARFARASLGAYSLAAFAWLFRPTKIPWEALVVARVRVILRHYGLTAGSLVIDDTDPKRSKAAMTLAPLDKLREKESGGYSWGQRLVFLLLVTPTITIPVGFPFYKPAPELSAWYKQERKLKPRKAPTPQRPPKPPPNPPYPTTQELALRLLPQGKDHYPDLRVHCLVADALSGASTFVDAASAIWGGVQVISHVRSHQKVRVYKHAQHVADSCATHPGTPQKIRLRGGEEVVAIVGSARMYVYAHHPKRFILARKDDGEATSRSLMASDLCWRTLEIVQGHPLRWRGEGFVQDWKSPEGWSQLTKQPGDEGARRSVILSLLVDHCRFFHPDQQAQLRNNLPADTVGSLRANVQVECLVDVRQERLSSTDPQGPLPRFTQAVHELFAFGRSTKHLIQRQLGHLEPLPYLKYRANEVMRNMPMLST
jgi:hypothetical protein